ncbi:Hypothetical protein ABZS17I87_02546 [Kosakonia cowanii]
MPGLCSLTVEKAVAARLHTRPRRGASGAPRRAFTVPRWSWPARVRFPGHCRRVSGHPGRRGRGVSMGDIDQFESPESGAPFRLVQERSPMDVAIMKQIVRQKEVNLRDAVHDVIDNRIDAALERLKHQPADLVAREAPDWQPPAEGLAESDNPVSDLVADWLSRTPKARAETLIIAQLNDDRAAINREIFDALDAREELGQKKISVPVLEKIKHTRHEFNKLAAPATWSCLNAARKYSQRVPWYASPSLTVTVGRRPTRNLPLRPSPTAGTSCCRARTGRKPSIPCRSGPNSIWIMRGPSQAMAHRVPVRGRYWRWKGRREAARRWPTNVPFTFRYRVQNSMCRSTRTGRKSGSRASSEPSTI